MKAAAEIQLAGFIAKYSPPMAKLARAVRSKLRSRFRGAVEMVYDNYYALVIGYSPTERPSDAILSIGVYPRWVNLYFLFGRGLPDPHGLLQGNGKQVRFIRLHDAKMLDRPEVKELLDAAIEDSYEPLDPKRPRQLVIRLAAKKQRPRQ